ncbi:DUF5333 family protein [Mangrovicoccus algicola]|nr:DUF5333 family protein [Mangrovicoccus algicola]
MARLLVPVLPVAALAGLASCMVATPLVAPVMQRVLVDVATAQFVGDNCPSMGFDAARAKTYIANAYKNLVAEGADPETLETGTESFEQGPLQAQVAERLEEGGVNPENPQPANVCAFGAAEQDTGSILGRVLK